MNTTKAPRLRIVDGTRSHALAEADVVGVANLAMEAVPVRARTPVEAPPNVHPVKGFVAWVLKLFVGAPAVDPSSPWWFIRPIMFVLLLVLIAVLGWQTLYVTNGTNFGVGGALEYLGLFL